MELPSPRRAARRSRRFVDTLLRAIVRHRVIDLGAQLAFWSVLAIFPFAIFLLTLVGYLPVGRADEQLMAWLSPVMPEAALRLVWETVHEVLGRQRSGLLTISFLGGLWSAASGTSALQQALNRAYGVEETRPYWLRKGQALVTTLGASILLIVAVAGAAIGPEVIHKGLALVDLDDRMPGLVRVWAWVRWPASIAALIALLAAAYNFLPNVRHGYGLVSLGSVFAVALWLLVTFLFRHFVATTAGYARTYGALAAVFMLLTWFYLSGLSVILGAEVNAALARVQKEREEGDPVT